MAAPHVAGLAALMLDKNPNVYYQDIIDCMQFTSSNGCDGIVNGYNAIDCLAPPPCQGRCGNANGDASVNVSDAVYMINYVFVGGEAPRPVMACGNANGDSSTNVSDAVYIINFVFVGGQAPGDCHPGIWGPQGGDCCAY